MSANTFQERLQQGSGFVVIVEFSCPAGKKPEKVLKFLRDYAAQPQPPQWGGIELAGVSVTQNPSGVVTASPSDVLAHVLLDGGWRGLVFVPHVSGKGMNRGEVETYLQGLLSHGVENCFVVTGDKPLVGKSVFELDALNILQLIRLMNADNRVGTAPGKPAPRLFAGAAVGLSKYEEGTCLQQLIKLEKKIYAGSAGFIITNLIYDARKVEDFFRYLAERNITTPVMGNVFYLTAGAARRMRDEKLPGCYVSDRLYEKVQQEREADWVERAAQQVAMWKSLGARGVDMGNVEELALANRILTRAVEIGDRWTEYCDNLTFPLEKPDAFYVYDGEGKRTEPRDSDVPFRRTMLNWTHNLLLEPGSTGYNMVQSIFRNSKGLKNAEGLFYEATTVMEFIGKRVIANCRHCGDCYLPENFFVCTMGECTKGLSNPPCGDATAEGRCGVDIDRLCAGQLIYDAARYFGKGTEALCQLMNASRNPDLQDTASLRNYYLAEDHHKRAPITLVGEMLHTTIPRIREAFELIRAGGDTFAPDNEGVQYLKSVIESQALRKPDYLDANVDEAGEGDRARTQHLMRNAVRLILEHGGGIPPCVDSSDVEVIKAGLEEYYRPDPPFPPYQGGSRECAPPPLINSANAGNVDQIWEAMAVGPCRVVYMLMESSLSENAEQQFCTPDEVLQNALTFFRAATERSVRPDQIFFDTTVMPLSIEFSCFDRPGHNYVSFTALDKIMHHPEMKGVGSILGISNLTRDFPPGRKLGLQRAYLKLAMDRGLSAAIVDVSKEFGTKPPEDEEIIGIVDAFIQYDGSPEAYARMQDAYQLYRNYGGKK